jgi:hypothetical protein
LEQFSDYSSLSSPLLSSEPSSVRGASCSSGVCRTQPHLRMSSPLRFLQQAVTKESKVKISDNTISQ